MLDFWEAVTKGYSSLRLVPAKISRYTVCHLTLVIIYFPSISQPILSVESLKLAFSIIDLLLQSKKQEVCSVAR